ncbi:hypothetical protein GCM10025864_14440 [Luteimicrobium album]|uniref:Uncharacterized protein n=1 Tax=Luteimicrobium album TaxID=1054550 RepID=A0ABQ6I1M9_9MICO|nr:hypothetical protein GCM10025864_14440 [Luteimicrobium album]
MGDVVGGAERVGGPRGDEGEERAECDAEADREPEAVDAGLERLAPVAGADPARDGGGGGVGEEDTEADEGGQKGRRDGKGCELRGAEVTDDSAVDEDEDRLRDEGAEGRDREGEDLAVEGAGVGGRAAGVLRRVAREISVHSSTG